MQQRLGTQPIQKGMYYVETNRLGITVNHCHFGRNDCDVFFLCTSKGGVAMITVAELIERLETLDPKAIVMVYDTINFRVAPIDNVRSDEYLNQDKLKSRLRITNQVNLKPGQAIARLSY